MEEGSIIVTWKGSTKRITYSAYADPVQAIFQYQGIAIAHNIVLQTILSHIKPYYSAKYTGLGGHFVF